MTTSAPATAETILQEDGAQAALAEFAEKVRGAEELIRQVLADAQPGTQWSLRELRDLARAAGWSSSVVTTALFNLDESGELVVDYVTSTVTASA